MQVEGTRLGSAQVGEPPREPQSLRDSHAGLAGAVGAAVIADQMAILRSAPGSRAVLGLPHAVREVGRREEHGGSA